MDFHVGFLLPRYVPLPSQNISITAMVIRHFLSLYSVVFEKSSRAGGPYLPFCYIIGHSVMF